jgi:DNA processing protein
MAHRACLELGLPTVGVMGHGHDKMYPDSHSKYAKEMLENGALLTEFKTGTKPDRENFPKRNRIVAGMTDATIVVESGVSGGSIITAKLANGYNRDVFAIPGSIYSERSEGCNRLLKSHQAALLESAKDLEYIMGWAKKEKAKTVQTKIFVDLKEEEELILDVMREKGKMQIDSLSLETELTMSQAMVHLLNLELNGLVRSLPGKKYEVC